MLLKNLQNGYDICWQSHTFNKASIFKEIQKVCTIIIEHISIFLQRDKPNLANSHIKKQNKKFSK